MGPSRRVHRASVATAIALVGATTVAIGAFEGLGAWIGALLVGGLLGGIATLSAIEDSLTPVTWARAPEAVSAREVQPVRHGSGLGPAADA